MLDKTYRFNVNPGFVVLTVEWIGHRYPGPLPQPFVAHEVGPRYDHVVSLRPRTVLDVDHTTAQIAVLLCLVTVAQIVAASNKIVGMQFELDHGQSVLGDEGLVRIGAQLVFAATDLLECCHLVRDGQVGLEHGSIGARQFIARARLVPNVQIGFVVVGQEGAQSVDVRFACVNVEIG